MWEEAGTWQGLPFYRKQIQRTTMHRSRWEGAGAWLGSRALLVQAGVTRYLSRLGGPCVRLDIEEAITMNA